MLLDSIGMNTLNWHCCNHEMTTVSTVHWNLVKTRVCQDSNQRKQMRDSLVNQWVFSPCHVCIRIHWSFFVATTHAVSGSNIANHPTRGNSDCTGRKQHLHLGWLDTHRLLLSHTQTSMKCFWKSVFTKTDVCCLLENKPWLQTTTIITFRTTYYVCVCVCVVAIRQDKVWGSFYKLQYCR